MAYLARGFTDASLAALYYRAVREGRDDAYLVARFGAPLQATTQRRHGLSDVRHGGEAVPYDFLGQQPMRTYNQLGEPHFVDERGRQYYGAGESQPGVCYCRIPMGITRRENAERVFGVFRTDFPNPGDELHLRPARAFDAATRRNVPERTVVVQRRLAQTIAVCRLLISETLPLPADLDVDALEAAADGGADNEGGGGNTAASPAGRAQQLLDLADAAAGRTEEALRRDRYQMPAAVVSAPSPARRAHAPTVRPPAERGTTVRIAKPARAPRAKLYRSAT